MPDTTLRTTYPVCQIPGQPQTYEGPVGWDLSIVSSGDATTETPSFDIKILNEHNSPPQSITLVENIELELNGSGKQVIKSISVPSPTQVTGPIINHVDIDICVAYSSQRPGPSNRVVVSGDVDPKWTVGVLAVTISDERQ